MKEYDSCAWLLNHVPAPDKNARQRAEAHQQQLTKPPGSLGDLENLAIRFAACQGKEFPEINTIGVRVFAADHGIVAQNVSAFPQVVTAQMVNNFIAGGAAISILSRALNADFAVVDMGVKHTQLLTVGENVQAANDIHNQACFIRLAVAKGTADFSQTEAMTAEQLSEALNAAKTVLQNKSHWDVFIAGEMGIGNTSSASAIYSALHNLPAEKTVGPGTGVTSAALMHKCEVVQQSLEKHMDSFAKLEEPWHSMKILQCLGGFEVAALTASYIFCAQQRIPSIVDGFIATAAASLAIRINPSIKPWLLFSHVSAEPAHRHALEALQVKPLLDLSMRLGEGSGAAVVVPLIQNALRLHREMATFSDAGVANQ